MKKGDEVPEDHKNCSRCGTPYGFIKCRYTLMAKGQVINICLSCAPTVKTELLSQWNKKTPLQPRSFFKHAFFFLGYL